MGVSFSFWLYEFFFWIFVCLLGYYIYFKLIGSKYWQRRNVFQSDPVFLLGSDWKTVFSESIGFVNERRYREWKHKKLVGFWSFTFPTVLVTDLELIKRILVRDFSYFRDRNTSANEEKEPLAGHLVNLTGSKWRNLRVKLTPTFTSGKMKMMFPIMIECGLQMQKYLLDFAENGGNIEIKEIFARFTTDVISSCAFGIESNCMNHPASEFRIYGRKIFETDFLFPLKSILTTFFPRIRDILGIRFIPKDVTEFFLGVVKDTMDYRQQKGIKRNDFMDLLIQLKNKGKITDVDSTQDNDNKEHDKEQKFSLNQAAAQAFVFFAAGFETSSTTLSFAFYELAINPDIQATLQREIDLNLKKNEGKLVYEDILEMEYLDWVVQETLRKYPPLTLIGRKCNKDYEIPEMNVKLEKGTGIVISILGIHKDPEYYVNPEKFDPNRFSPEERAKRDHFTHLPFGEGPRICIGSRFGLLQTKIGLVSVLSQFNVEVCEETPIPLVFNKKTFVLTSTSGIYLRITKRK